MPEFVALLLCCVCLWVTVVMTDFELHNLCCKSPPLHPHKLDEECILDSGKFSVLRTLLPKLQAKVRALLLSGFFFFFFFFFFLVCDLMCD